MTDYMLTAIGADGWRDVLVRNAPDIRDAIARAERVTGCRVSHGRGGNGKDFHPNLTIHADTGRVVRNHDNPAKPDVQMGPPDVMAALAAAVR